MGLRTKIKTKFRSSQFSIFSTNPGAIKMICNTIYMKLRLDISSILFTFSTSIRKGDYTIYYRVLKKECNKRLKILSTEIKRYINRIFLIFNTKKCFVSMNSVHRKWKWTKIAKWTACYPWVPSMVHFDLLTEILPFVHIYIFFS